MAREYALQFLYQHEMNPEPLEAALPLFWAGQESADQEMRDFAERIIRGTLEHIKDLDPIISKYTDNWQINRMAAVDRNIMRLGTYELLYMDDIPPKVSINEAVNMAKKFSQIDSGKFVNGVLDKINHTEKPSTPSAS